MGSFPGSKFVKVYQLLQSVGEEECGEPGFIIYLHGG